MAWPMFNTTTVSSAFGFNADPKPEDPEALHVIIVHDDHAAYVRALRMLANTFFGRPEASAMRPLPWRFEARGGENRWEAAVLT